MGYRKDDDRICSNDSVMLPVESQPVDFKKALERARKLEVHGEFLHLDTCSPLKDVSNIIQEDPGLVGKGLFDNLLQNVRSLEGRVVGRNKEDVQTILQGLELLYKEWQSLQLASKQAAQQCAEEAAAYVAEVQRLQLSPAACRAGSTPCDEQLSEVVKERSELAAMLQSEKQHRLQLEAQVVELIKDVESARNAKTFWEASAGNIGQDSSCALVGRGGLGETIRVLGPAGGQPPIQVQWFRSTGVGWEAIIGATRCQYSPEPCDVGAALACRLTPAPSSLNPSPEQITLTSPQPVANLKGLEEYVETLEASGVGRFSVVIVQLNGALQTHRQVCTLEVSRQGISLMADGKCTLRRCYEEGMQEDSVGRLSRQETLRSQRRGGKRSVVDFARPVKVQEIVMLPSC